MFKNPRAGLAVLLIGVCAATGASAHDMTDEMLTQRSATCADYAAKNTAKAVDVQNRKRYTATVNITVKRSKCTISSNAIPNHNFNATGRFATPVSQQKSVLYGPSFT